MWGTRGVAGEVSGTGEGGGLEARGRREACVHTPASERCVDHTVQSRRSILPASSFLAVCYRCAPHPLFGTCLNGNTQDGHVLMGILKT